MKKFTEDQMVNFKAAMERINSISSAEVFEDIKSGAKIAKDHMLKTIKYLGVFNKFVKCLSCLFFVAFV